MNQSGSRVNPPARTGDDAGAGPATPDARRQRWQGHREARRAQLVEAAVRVVRRDGAGAGMDAIAAEAGVTKPVLYRHFADQAELYLAVGQRVADTLLATLRAELAHQREPREHLAAVIDAYLAAIEAEPELYRFVTRRTFADRPVARAVVTDLVTGYTALIADAVARVLAERLPGAGPGPSTAEPVQADALMAWGHGVVGLVQAAGDWWLDHRATAPATDRATDGTTDGATERATPRARLTEQLTALLWNGLSGALAGSNHGVSAGAEPAGAPKRPSTDA